MGKKILASMFGYILGVVIFLGIPLGIMLFTFWAENGFRFYTTVHY